jgi:outer membrane protein OmpA-like peptidoglycan-associated protein
MLRGLFPAAVLLAAVLVTSGSAEAQVSKDEIIRSLKPAQPLTRTLRRSIEIVPGKEEQVLDEHKDLPKINLKIEFEYDSDQPTTVGLNQLATLAEALKDPSLRSFRFMLAGHTDARGSDEYNQKLSERRALAVERYLVGNSKLDPSLLHAVGFGKKRLLDPDDPMNARNRRVEIVNILN